MVLSTSPLHGLASLSAPFPRSSILYFKDIKHGVGELCTSPLLMFFLMWMLNVPCHLAQLVREGDVAQTRAGVDMRAKQGLSPLRTEGFDYD